MAAICVDLPDLLDRLDAEHGPIAGAEAGQWRFLRGSLEEAFTSAGGLRRLPLHALSAPEPLTTAAGLLAARRYLERALFHLRERAFALYGADPARCRAVIDGLHATLFDFWEELARHTPEASAGASHDPATGLPGHVLLLRRLGALLEASPAGGGSLAVLVIALGFAQAGREQASFGQSEALFAQAAARLKRALRADDTLARLTRDRFAALLPRLPGAGVAVLAASKLLRALEEPFGRGDNEALARATVGIATHPAHSSDAESLLHFAEVACAAAREAPERFAVYDPEAHRQDRIRVSLEAQLRTALHENDLELYLQPQAHLASGRISGAEALLRWQLKDGSAVSAGQVVAVAEDAGLVSDLTMWVFKAALRILAGLLQSGVDLTLSVNVTPSNLAEPELPEFISQTLKTWEVPPENLVVELTEGAMIGQTERTLGTLHALKSLGVKLSVDDFGTGYSSLAYLKRMPLDELKIDQVFVRNMLRVRADERIVRSVINLAHHFDLLVVAEGVEDGPTLDFLHSLGCDLVQGYHLARPMPVAQFGEWWRARDGLLAAPPA